MIPGTSDNSNTMAEQAFALTAADNYFDTSHLKNDFKARCVRGGAITTFGQAVRFIIQACSTIVLARLLTPQDYGLVAMVMAFTEFMMSFKDLGLSAATVQRAETNHEQISTLFWINVAFCTVAMLVTIALAPVIAWFYKEPRLTMIAMALSISFLFIGLGIQHQALLRRQMNFWAIVTRDVASMLVGAALAIALAWGGKAYWALVGMQVGTAAVSTILLWAACRWRPGLPVRGAGVGSMVHFGMSVTGFQIINYFARNMDKILLGRFYGSYVTGLYSRAYSLFMLPITQIRAPLVAVAMPALSRLQKEPREFAKYYYKLVFVLAFITMPLMGFLFVCSESVIRLLLGPKWMDTNVIFKIMAFAGFIQAVETTRGLNLVSLGLSKRYFQIGVFVSISFVLSYIIGIPWGACGVALAYAISQYLIMIPSLWYSFRHTPVSVSGFFKTISGPVITSLTATAIMFLAYEFLLAGQSDIIAIVVCLVLGMISYLIMWVLIPGGANTLRELFSYILLIVRRK
ncbi:MAG: lipopolysaccharide biosynthesis protein [Sedimentisphaerales bacterium]